MSNAIAMPKRRKRDFAGKRLQTATAFVRFRAFNVAIRT
jgi:hypothetical protein